MNTLFAVLITIAVVIAVAFVSAALVYAFLKRAVIKKIREDQAAPVSPEKFVETIKEVEALPVLVDLGFCVACLEPFTIRRHITLHLDPYPDAELHMACYLQACNLGTPMDVLVSQWQLNASERLIDKAVEDLEGVKQELIEEERIARLKL